MMSAFGCVNNTIRLRSGRYFDLARPKAEDVNIEDIAAALSKICRFGGQINEFYSVAEHSCLCAQIALRDGRPAECIKAVLLHDAAEAFIGDVVKPLKIMLPTFSAIERSVEDAIQHALGVNFTVWKEVISEIDHAMLIHERRRLFSSDNIEWPGESNVRKLNVAIGCFPPDKAERVFKMAFHDISGMPF